MFLPFLLLSNPPFQAGYSQMLALTNGNSESKLLSASRFPLKPQLKGQAPSDWPIDQNAAVKHYSFTWCVVFCTYQRVQRFALPSNGMPPRSPTLSP